jgi:branched-chain amino acid transport system permease protein
MALRNGSLTMRLMTVRAGRVKLVVVLVLLAAAVLVPTLGSNFYVSLVSNFLIFGLLAMSLDLMAGYTGLVSLGHAAALGIGAYGVAVGMARGLSADASIGLALLVILVTAAAFGLVAVRVGGITFVMLTLALGQIVWGLAYRWVSISGGDNGLPVGDRPSIGPIDLGTSDAYYYFVLVVFVVCAALMWLLVRSPFGLSLRGIQDNQQRMRTLGYNVWLHKYLVYVISSFFGGIAGILFAFFNSYVSPTAIDFPHNGTVVQMVVVGGLGTLWGPFVGAILIVLMQQYVSIYVARWVTVLGIIFVLVVLFARGGVWGLVKRFGLWLTTKVGGAAEVPGGRAGAGAVGLEELEASR